MLLTAQNWLKVLIHVSVEAVLLLFTGQQEQAKKAQKFHFVLHIWQEQVARLFSLDSVFTIWLKAFIENMI